MKKLNYCIFLSLLLLLFNCDNGEIKHIRGSWYRVDTISYVYEEIHTNDTLLVYCYDNCDIVISFDITLSEDSLLMFSSNQLKHRYHLFLENVPQKRMILISDKDTLVFEYLNAGYTNLEAEIENHESLGSLSMDYFNRKWDIIDSLRSDF
jgi:hypothetical protein